MRLYSRGSGRHNSCAPPCPCRRRNARDTGCCAYIRMVTQHSGMHDARVNPPKAGGCAGLHSARAPAPRPWRLHARAPRMPLTLGVPRCASVTDARVLDAGQTLSAQVLVLEPGPLSRTASKMPALGPAVLSSEDEASLQTTASQRGICMTWLVLQAGLWAKALAAPGSLATIAATPVLSLAHAAALCVAAWAAADLFVGIFHWSVDNYGDEATPVMGATIAAFQGHHDHPWLITRGELCTIIDGPCVATMPMLMAAILWSSPPVAVVMAFYTAWSVLAQLTHKWSHERRCTMPPLVARLQDAHVFISCTEHRRHHAPPINSDYCILSGLWNKPLQQLHFFPALERVIFAVSGVMPRSWCGKVPQ